MNCEKCNKEIEKCFLIIKTQELVCTKCVNESVLKEFEIIEYEE